MATGGRFHVVTFSTTQGDRPPVLFLPVAFVPGCLIIILFESKHKGSVPLCTGSKVKAIPISVASVIRILYLVTKNGYEILIHYPTDYESLGIKDVRIFDHAKGAVIKKVIDIDRSR